MDTPRSQPPPRPPPPPPPLPCRPPRPRGAPALGSLPLVGGEWIPRGRSQPVGRPQPRQHFGVGGRGAPVPIRIEARRHGRAVGREALELWLCKGSLVGAIHQLHFRAGPLFP